MKKNLAIVLEFGFHEIKKYIHSGFAAALSKEFNIVWIALDKGSKDFDTYFRSTGFPLIYVSEKDLVQAPLKIEQYNIAVRKNWLANQELGAFHNHSQVKTKNWRTALYGNSLLKRFFEKRTLKEVKSHYFNSKIAEIYQTHNINLLLTTGYASSFAKTSVITAQKRGVGVYFLVNSWKDLFINNFVPFQNLKGLFVWSETMKQDYLKQMPYLKKEIFTISGNPTFDVFINFAPTFDREYYSKKYQLPTSSVWLLYTMLSDLLIKDEFETILFTANQLASDLTQNEAIIIVRKNPMDNQFDFPIWNLPNNIRFAEHFSTYDKLNDMIVQSKEGENEWLDLIYHSDYNLSVPSTVTLEFLQMNKTVLNIAYNSKGKLDHRINQFFDAGFYRPLFELDSVIKINHPKEISNFLQKNRTKSSEISKPIAVRAATIIIDTLKK